MEEIRVAIIGGGFGTSAHLPAFASIPGVKVVVLADGGSGRACSSAKRGIKYFPTWEEALDCQGLDAVSVVVPPILHRQIVMASLERGLHVFCEKPFGMSVADAEAMLGQVRASRLTGAVNFQFRFEPGIETMRELVIRGTIGRLLGIDLSWLTEGRTKSECSWGWQHDAAIGGGVVNALFSHVADLFSWFVGEEVKTVFGHTHVLIPERSDHQGNRHSVTAEDFMSAQVTFSQGVVATCRVSNCQPGGSGMVIELRGDLGMLVYSSRPPYQLENCIVQLLLNRKPPQVFPIGGSTTESWSDSRVRAVLRCVERFVRSVKGNAEPSIPSFKDGLRAQRLMQALRQSAGTGETIQLDS